MTGSSASAKPWTRRTGRSWSIRGPGKRAPGVNRRSRASLPELRGDAVVYAGGAQGFEAAAEEDCGVGGKNNFKELTIFLTTENIRIK